MSRTSVLYIEYRKNDASPWRWVRPLMPSQDIDWAEKDPGYMVDTNGTDNKEEYKFVYELSKQGTIRDLFNDYNVEFNDRGFPADMSEDLKKFMEKDPDQFDGIWGKSYASLQEIIDCINLNIKNTEVHKQEYINKHNNVTIHQKLDLIMKSLGGVDVQSELINMSNNEDEDTEADDDYNEYILEYDELIDDYKYCLSFFEGINQIVDFCTNSWADATDIRIIYFTC